MRVAGALRSQEQRGISMEPSNTAHSGALSRRSRVSLLSLMLGVVEVAFIVALLK